MELTIIRRGGRFVADSRDVAEMIEKRHDNLVRDIDGYAAVLGHSSDLRTDDFFVADTYSAGTGKAYKHYWLTRKGCDMVANKMTGEKGVLFTAMYVTRFEEMERGTRLSTSMSTILREVKAAAELYRLSGRSKQEAFTLALQAVQDQTGRDLSKFAPEVKEKSAIDVVVDQLMTYIHEIAMRPLLNQSQPIANGEEWCGFWKDDNIVALYPSAFRAFLAEQEYPSTQLKRELALQKVLLAGKEEFAKTVRDPSVGKAVKAYVIRVKR